MHNYTYLIKIYITLIISCLSKLLIRFFMVKDHFRTPLSQVKVLKTSSIPYFRHVRKFLVKIKKNYNIYFHPLSLLVYDLLIMLNVYTFYLKRHLNCFTLIFVYINLLGDFLLGVNLTAPCRFVSLKVHAYAG